MAESTGRGKSKAKRMVVAAIDFGTTYSGYAFSFNHDFEKDPTKIAANQGWVAGTGSLMSSKTPTVLLLDNNKKFVAFGYEAETKYADIAADEEHQSYYYFRRFKMMLHKISKPLRRDTTIPDDKGRPLQAMLVFSLSIKYLKAHLMDTLNKRIPGISDNDVLWVLTVPAIWSDGSKQFMREAADMAGIKKEDLLIALEPEAASLFCMHLPVDKLITTGMTESQRLAAFSKGTRYMVVDVGGGTVDITIHEVVETGKLKELNYASGGAWGGTRVDAAYENFLRSIVGDKVFDKFAQDSKEDWIDLFREFETKKRSIKDSDKPEERSRETVKIPVRLSEILEKLTGRKLEAVIKDNKSLSGKVTCRGDKLRLDTEIFKSWFDESCTNTVKHVQKLFQLKSSEGTNTILLVGGFSESHILQDAIRKNFPDKRLIIPEEAGLVVLKGATIFGHDPVTIVSRIAKCSYGIRVYRDFQDGVHPKNKKVTIGGKAKCKDVFALHVKKGQELVVGQAQTKQRYTPLEADQVSLVFDIYTSDDEDPQYVTDVGCTYIGQLEVDVPDISGGKERGVWVQMIFGGTELVVEAREEKSKQLTRAKFDFLQSSHHSENTSDSA